MPRKRMLDPGIWTDEKIMQLSDSAFIVFIGCVSNADDEGIFETNPDSLFFKLARKNIPPTTIAESIDDITENGLIIRFGVYAFFPNWYKHQTLNRPSQTKLRRPPAAEIQKLPLYIQGWENAFSYYKGKGDSREYVQVQYPLTDTALQFTEPSLSTHGALIPNRSEVNRSERKGKEGNGSEGGGGNDLTVIWTRDGELCKQAWSSFVKYNGAPIPDHTKEIDAMNRLIFLASERGDVPVIILAMMKKFKELKDEDTTRKGFWRGQPYIPSRLVALWNDVWEAAKIEATDQSDLEELFPDDS